MKFTKILSISLSVFFLLSSCAREQPNIINYFVTLSPYNNDIELTVNSNIGTLTREIIITRHESTRTSIVYAEVPFEISTAKPDTVFISSRSNYGDYHVKGYQVELMNVNIFKEDSISYSETGFFKAPVNDLEFFLEESRDIQVANVLFELDLEASLSTDSLGNHIFDPIFQVKKI